MITFVVIGGAIIRRGLRLILESQPDFKVVGEADIGIEAERVIEELKPSVLVTSGSFEGMELTKIATSRHSSGNDGATSVVLLFNPSEKGHVHRALRAGAKGCVLTESEPEELIGAVREVTKDRYFLSPELSQDLIKQFASRDFDRYETLTVRESQVLRLAGAGYSNDEIAHRLGISRRTVEIHRLKMSRKMGLVGRGALTRFAIENGMERTEQPLSLAAVR